MLASSRSTKSLSIDSRVFYIMFSTLVTRAFSLECCSRRRLLSVSCAPNSLLRALLRSLARYVHKALFTIEWMTLLYRSSILITFRRWQFQPHGILTMRAYSRGSSISEFTRVNASAKCWMPQSHGAPVPTSSYCAPVWLGDIERVPLEEDSGCVTFCSSIVGSGGGGGSVMIFFSCCAYFEGGLDVPIVALHLRVARAASVNFFFPLLAIFT